jgi:hypothetical protein
MKTEQEIKDLFVSMYGSKTLKYGCNHLLPEQGDMPTQVVVA